MATPRRNRFLSGQLAVLFGTALALAALGAFSYDLFVLLSALGVVVAADLLTAARVRPRWHGGLRWLLAAAVVAAALAIGHRLVELFAPELLP